MAGSVENVDVDKIWIGLGRFGKFQLRQTFIFMIGVWSCGFHMLSIVFIAYRPKYECQEESANVSTVPNTSVSFNHGKCSTTMTTNASGAISVLTEDCPYGWAYHEFGEKFNVERSIISEWNLVCDRSEYAELSQTLVMLGQGIGAFLFTSLADRYGRKPVHVGCHVTLFLIVLATAFMPGFAGFAVMRALTGAFLEGSGLSMAIMCIENFPKEVRGNVQVLSLLFWTTGIALVTPIGYIFRNSSWRHFQICLACLSSWSLVEWFLIDESLRWLIANGKVEKAKELIQRACKVNKKDYHEVAAASGFDAFERLNNETKEITIGLITNTEKSEDTSEINGALVETDREKVVDSQNKLGTKSYTVIDLFKSRRLLMASLIVWITWITNSITYYGIMLISSSLAGNRFLNFFLGSVVEYPAAFIEYSIINRYGRKPACIMFHCVCGVALVIATILHTTADGNNAMVLGSTVFTLIGKFAITGSFSTIFLYTPELYPTNLRNVGIGMASFSSRIGGIAAPFARNLAEVAVWAPGLVFGTMCAIVSVLLFWLPETNQYELPQTLEECEHWYKENQFKLPCNKDRRAERERDHIQQDHIDAE